MKTPTPRHPQNQPPKQDKAKLLEAVAKVSHKQPDTFFNTCITVIAVLIVITLICMAIIMLKCFSHMDVNILRSSQVPLMEPCEDFYEFACGGWTKAVVVPPDEVTASVHTRLLRRVEDEIGEILNNTVVTYRYQTATQKAAALYQSCINVDMRNSKGTRPLEELLSYLGLPRWPILNRTAQFPTYQILGHVIRELGLDAIVSVRVGLDYYDSDRYLIYIGQPSFGVEPPILQGRYRSPFFRILHRYKLYMYRCALLMGSNVAAADVVNEIVSFEAKLAAITEPKDVVHNPRRVYNLMALRTLEGAIPEVRWTYFLNVILRDVGVSMDLNDHVVVRNPIYLKKLSRLLKSVSSSIVANYLGWRIVQEMGQHAMGRFRQARFRFDHYRYLLLEPTEVPRQCVRVTMRLMGFAVGRLYYDRQVTKAAIRFKGVNEMAEELRQAFSVLIDMNHWMDTKTKERALSKLSRMQLNIGFPPWIRSDRELGEYYQELPDLRKEDFFRNVLIATRIYYRTFYGRLRQIKKANDFGWLASDPASSMHYSLIGNYLLLPLEFLQFPFFLVDMPPPINFGALGTIIAQQISYGFGDQGSLYDENGKLSEWWSRDTRRKFLPRVRCLQEQYSEFKHPITGVPLDINTTMETSVADNAGVRLAFKAFRVYQTKFEERYSLYTIPGTEPKSMEQIFFIAYALSRCEVTRKRSIYNYLQPREQIPNWFRTTIPLMNFERFSHAFGCKVGTIMSPERKCLVW
ncbi:neprilysin-1-like isoform X2 [Dermacentor albipictus]|uniref:neprilysin-1-like isoform X2 n=1 Tax=Dermacentor albipictus TaxID=60249 RepID=UPI0038FD233F